MKEINNPGGHTPNGKMRIAFDFDGVIHSFKSGWLGPTIANDPPVEGAIRMLINLISMHQMQVCIFSTRNFQEGGIETMKKYLVDNGLEEHLLDAIEFPLEKDGFHVLIDDRAFPFEGTFPAIDDLIKFKSWVEKPKKRVYKKRTYKKETYGIKM